jgi:hypothetical protein
MGTMACSYNFYGILCCLAKHLDFVSFSHFREPVVFSAEPHLYDPSLPGLMGWTRKLTFCS